jgi:hypothetical protein
MMAYLLKGRQNIAQNPDKLMRAIALRPLTITGQHQIEENFLPILSDVSAMCPVETVIDKCLQLRKRESVQLVVFNVDNGNGNGKVVGDVDD